MKHSTQKHAFICTVRQHVKRAAILAMSLVLLCFFLSGCNALKSARPITDVHALDGQRVGVGLAWGPDYILSQRDDVLVMRYNSVAGAVTALRYRQVDAVAVEKPLAIEIVNSVPGLRYIEEPITQDSISVIVPPNQEELKQELNDFIAAFVQTPECQDLVARLNDPNGYTPKQVPLPGGDRVLHVGAVADAYPFSYFNTETNSFEGTDIEFLCHFANACGYDLAFYDNTWESMENGIQYGQYDIGCGGVSTAYRDDFELNDYARMTDPFLSVDIVFVVQDESSQTKQ